MVDVSPKSVTERLAVASARVRGRPEVIRAILAGDLPKGEALAVARVAGIQAAKKTADLIPLCHPMSLDWVEVAIRQSGDDHITIEATAKTTSRTGVEMEAMTAAAVAALTLYDMAKAADKEIEIGPIRLEKKSGGKSGTFIRTEGKEKEKDLGRASGGGEV
jgi:cyclic pyranopterin phosphate synthase